MRKENGIQLDKEMKIRKQKEEWIMIKSMDYVHV